MMLTVLMPVYNAEKYLKKAIDGILSQSFADFELLIINDGSTDSSVGIINHYQDPRIKLIHNEQNLGLIKTLNKGISLAQGRYIARHDADDFSAVNRFAQQVSFLKANPHYALVGTRARIWHGSVPSPFLYANHADYEGVTTELLFNNPFAHGSIMAKTEVMQAFLYDENYPVAEDYELWTRIAQKYPVANLPNVLYHYRFHTGGESVKKAQTLIDSVQQIRVNTLLNIGFERHEIDEYAHLLLSSRGVIQKYSGNDIERISLWIERILSKNAKTHTYSQDLLRKQLGSLWVKVFQNQLSLWVRGWKNCKKLRVLLPIRFLDYLVPDPVKVYRWFF